MDSDFKMVEINGVKIEVDMRTARKVESYKIGDRVKVLVKEYSGYKPYPGVIVAFDMFEHLPTITVAYLDISYAGADIKFAYINDNEDKGETEIAPYVDDILVDKADTIKRLDKAIEGKQAEIDDLEAKKAYFNRNFALYFAEFEDLAERVDG